MNDDLCNLHPLEAQGKRSDGETGICPVQLGDALHVLLSGSQLSEASTSDTRHTGRAQSVVSQMTPFDQQIEQMTKLAEQHYGKGTPEPLAYLNTLLTQRLREYATKFVRLEVRDVAPQ